MFLGDDFRGLWFTRRGPINIDDLLRLQRAIISIGRVMVIWL